MKGGSSKVLNIGVCSKPPMHVMHWSIAAISAWLCVVCSTGRRGSSCRLSSLSHSY